MVKNVPKHRLFVYMMLLSVIPILIAILYGNSLQHDVKRLRESIQELQNTALIQEKKQAVNSAVRNNFREADHFYIDKYLETITFLESEIESLQKIQTNSLFAEDEAVRKRLEFLNGPGNALAFTEGVVGTTPISQEVCESLVHPVEINNSDLQKLLARIEGITIGEFTPGPNRPQLIVTDFKLDRKQISEKNEVFILNLKLLKREFL